ncbi:MAG: phosphotransferase [Planctomycetota bacterium]
MGPLEQAPHMHDPSVRLTDENLPHFLAASGWLSGEENVAVEPAGDGNINFVRRVTKPSGESVIVKQARPELERFPEYRVTTDRMLFEHRYGKLVRQLAPRAAAILPAVYHFDTGSRVMVMEDLGDGARLDQVLAGGGAPVEAMHKLGECLATVHCGTAAAVTDLAEEFRNEEMQRLHGEHIFTLPYQENPFPIPVRVREHAEGLLTQQVRERIASLRACYYGTPAALVHGDVQSGNVVLQGNSPRLLDAEIAHLGDPAFDLGTALAHLHFHVPLHADAAGLLKAAGALVEGYRLGATAQGERPPAAFWIRAEQYAAVELLRRTLGAARHAVVQDDEAAVAVLDHAAEMLAR